MNDLFVRLSGLRDRTADQQRISPHNVFSDMELQMICALLPQRMKDLTLLTDVRREKIEKYVLLFLTEIRVYGGTQ